MGKKNGREYLSARQIAERYGVTPAAVSNVCKRWKIPHKLDRRIKLYDIEIYSDIYENKVRGKAHNNPYDLPVEELERVKILQRQKLELQVKKSQVELDTMEKNLIPWSEVEGISQEFGLAMRDFWETHSAMLARDIAEKMSFSEDQLQEISVLLENLFEKFLRNMSAYLDKYKALK